MAGAHNPLHDEFASEKEPAPVPALPPSPADPPSQAEPCIVVSRADADVALDAFAAECGEAVNNDAIAEFVLVRPGIAATASAPAGVAHDNGAAVAVMLPRRPRLAAWWVAAALATGLAAGFLLAAWLDGGWSAVTTRETSRIPRSNAVPSERVVASPPREAPTPQSATAQPPTPLTPPPVVTPTKPTAPPTATPDIPRRDVTASPAVEAIPSGSLPSGTQAPARTTTAPPERPIPPLSQVAAASGPSTTAPALPPVIVPDTTAAAAVEPRPTPHLPASLAPAPLMVEPAPATVSAYPGAAASASPNAAPTPVSEESAIAAVLEQYRGATSALNARAVAAVWPSTNTRALERAFGQLSSQDLSFASCLTIVNGTRATAACEGVTTYVPRVGNRNPRVESREWRFELRKSGQRWVIDRVSAR